MGGGLLQHLSDTAVRWIDTLALGAVFFTFVGWLPHIAAAGSIVWIGLRISNEVLERRIKQQEYLLNKRKLDA